ncbi:MULTISPECIES: hypothetical protein [unclassified Streptomyces]|uniref:hypothetical protein n=1 Tax=unclassified Streptomyces TaxID=2593676 RepID=UPI0005ED06BD|nr:MULTISPECIES: hypothetical protein [unclassified Streptomyces]APU42316.1 hypothetical protein BSL84_23605 [Streptomyces sp. TN58]KJK54147.1 hypothetical protein UK14_03130 [Streptomyces sp. NRRL F-4428]
MDTTKPPAPNAAQADTTPVDLAKTEATQDTAAEARAETADLDAAADADLGADDFTEDLADEEQQPSHVGSAAFAIVSAGLSVVALSGSWVAGIVSERASVAARLELSQAAGADAQIAAQFVDPWHTTAMVNGVFSALALIIATFVLALPAFSTPERILPTWVRSVSWAGIGLGALGVLLFVLMYFDLLLAIPKAAS